MSIKNKIERLKESLPQGCNLIAVSKTQPAEKLQEAYNAGQRAFGENKAQELTLKYEVMPKDIEWHMIGHLQRNKVRKGLGLARIIHRVDSLRLAEEIQAMSAKFEEPIEVLIQVNISGEKSKFGIAPAAEKHWIEQMDTMINIRIRGLMCMAPFVDDAEKVRPVFQRGRELFEDVRRSGAAGEKFDILSMGMSSDFEVAIECGANLVRVGTAIFGEAKTGDAGHDDHHE